MTGLALSMYLIPGMMVGVEIQRHPDSGAPVFILDLLIVRLMFEVLTEE